MKIKSDIITQQDIARAMINPSSVFDEPEEVVRMQQLSRTQKIEILRRWELDARALQRATDESMTGGEAPPLDAVNAALYSLDPDYKTKSQFGKAPTKI